MHVRLEVALRPEYPDPGAQAFLRRLELAHPAIRRKVRWARMMDVFWLDVPLSREDTISAVSEIFWDPVLQWMFTGNLIPSAVGQTGTITDLLDAAPQGKGRFWALERRYRAGVTDNVGRTTLEALRIVTGGELSDAQTASGQMLLIEGPELDEEMLATAAKYVFCNELIETWTVLNELELLKSDRFRQDRIKRDLPRVTLRGSDQVEKVALEGLSDEALEQLSRERLWALTREEMQVIRDHFRSRDEQSRRRLYGLSDPTDVEMEVIAQTWSEHCKHKLFGANVTYRSDGSSSADEPGAEIPSEVKSLFKTTIVETTRQLPRPWLLSVFDDNAGIVAFDEDDAFCIKVETHNSPSALDPYGGALTGIVGVNRDILGCGMGAKPVFNTDVFCLAPPDYAKPLPERLLHPRRILEGVRRGVEHGGNQSGIPTVNGAMAFDERFLGKPLIYVGTGGMMPRRLAGRESHLKDLRPGDRICMVGGRIGKDGIHGATFSSLALDEASPASAVQLGDPITQKRMADFLLEARDQGLYRAITDNGAGGLSSSVGEMAKLAGGARIDVSRAKTKYPGLRPYELVVSESQERMTVAVPPEKLALFLELAARRGVEVSDLGQFTDTGSFDVFYGDRAVASLDLRFLHEGTPKLRLDALWSGRPPAPSAKGEAEFRKDAPQALLELLGHPNIASKEWLIRQYDHEVQGTSVIKPLHTAGLLSGQAMPLFSGPNDAGVIQPKPGSKAGIAVGCGLNPKLSDIDPYVMAQSAVDEAVRNVIASGADFGREDSFFALVDNFCWPDPSRDPAKAAALVRACYGLREAALALGAPLVSGKDSMKNDYRGRLGGRELHISVPPTLLMTAVAKVSDVTLARSSDFKHAGDRIYRLGGTRAGLWGSEFSLLPRWKGQALPGETKLGAPNWPDALKTYAWLGGSVGREQARLRSLHDVSEGGLLVAVAEGLLARGLGATLELPEGEDPWTAAFGEGFHGFVTSVSESDAAVMEAEWASRGVVFQRLGTVQPTGRFEVKASDQGVFAIDVSELRAAWKKEGYWE